MSEKDLLASILAHDAGAASEKQPFMAQLRELLLSYSLVSSQPKSEYNLQGQERRLREIEKEVSDLLSEHGRNWEALPGIPVMPAGTTFSQMVQFLCDNPQYLPGLVKTSK